MTTLTIRGDLPAASLLQWILPATLSASVALATTVWSLAPSVDLPPVNAAPMPQLSPAPSQPDASEVDWGRIEVEPDPSPLSVAAYGP